MTAWQRNDQLRRPEKLCCKRKRAGCFYYTKMIIPLLPCLCPAAAGVLLPQMMRMVEDQNLKHYGFESVQSVHLMAEVERLAYADRAKYLGDPDYYKVPVKSLISYPYIIGRMENFNTDSAGNSETIQRGLITRK